MSGRSSAAGGGADPGPIQGWALPSGFAPPGVERVEMDGGTVLEWPALDPVAALRLMDRLRATREALAARSATTIARVLGVVGERFLDPDDPIRESAIDAVRRESGFSPEMATRVVDGMARDWTRERLGRLLREEFGDPPIIDGPSEGARRIMAFGDALAVHVASGSVPGVATTSLIRSLLVKTPVLLKPGAGDVALAVLFARALAEADADLADACAVAYWPGGRAPAEEVVLSRADRVVVYGDDRTIRAVRAKAAPGAPIVEYGHRVGFSVAGPEAVDLDALAEAIGTFDQRGCVTTHQLFVTGTPERAEAIARELAGALARLEERLPRGALSPGEASALRQKVESAELRAAADERTHFFGGGTAGWTVTVEPDPGLEPGPGGRTVRVVAVKSLDQLAADVERLRLHLQTVGHGGFPDGGRALMERLGRVGVTRVVPFASVAFPPGWWLHDGRGPLRALVREVEWESAPS